MHFGMHKHYVKEIFTEFWDPHQLNVATKAGNKKFYDHLQKIGMEGTTTDLLHKYGHPGVKKYKKLLVSGIMGRPVKTSSTTAAPRGSVSTKNSGVAA